MEEKIKELDTEFGELNVQLHKLKERVQQITTRLIEIRGAVQTLKGLLDNG